MSWGVACKDCGWQETDHFNQLYLSEEEKELGKIVVSGYKVSLNSCLKFEFSNEGLMEAYDRVMIETDKYSQERETELEWIAEEFINRNLPLPEGLKLLMEE
ncbi:MAG: hypothetical protein AAB446_01825 [Patescibacteria group bacterium]